LEPKEKVSKIFNTGINDLSDGAKHCNIKLCKDKQLEETSGMLEDRIKIQRNCEKFEKSSKW